MNNVLGDLSVLRGSQPVLVVPHGLLLKERRFKSWCPSLTLPASALTRLRVGRGSQPTPSSGSSADCAMAAAVEKPREAQLVISGHVSWSAIHPVGCPARDHGAVRAQSSSELPCTQLCPQDGALKAPLCLGSPAPGGLVPMQATCPTAVSHGSGGNLSILVGG